MWFSALVGELAYVGVERILLRIWALIGQIPRDMCKQWDALMADGGVGRVSPETRDICDLLGAHIPRDSSPL